ncbi:hypothetical protein BJ138DRAFT_372891 [Hygrophoropsis aurantiaca]|uniref:Uncharacterized protein n=1 Tax=Hygrophoropsis aurantiaca TaxID=72124 RepID=A0ACB8A4A8_9AGAM|nr:hypothetical protein BJ138DRAFT_372891 [Hygrophoropsis aurantiaca]
MPTLTRRNLSQYLQSISSTHTGSDGNVITIWTLTITGTHMTVLLPLFHFPFLSPQTEKTYRVNIYKDHIGVPVYWAWHAMSSITSINFYASDLSTSSIKDVNVALGTGTAS